MIGNYKVVCNTAAGRRRYMQYLVPQVVAADVVDRYDIWINTTDKQDIAFFELLASKFPKINLVYQPDGIVNGIASINAFYKGCVEEDAIYFKLDDDIVWIEPNLFDKMVRFRVDNPDYFLVSPLVINNSLSTYILQNAGKITLDRYYMATSVSQTLWCSGEFASQLHEWFLNSYLKTGRYHELYCGKRPIAMARFSINSILWFGSEMKKFGGVVPGDDEEWLSCIKPTELGKVNCFNGDAILSHFAFFPQREMLDKRTILEQYGAFLHAQWGLDPKMSEIDATVQKAMREVEECRAEILSRPAIYKAVEKIKPTLKSKIGRWRIPVLSLSSLSQLKSRLSGSKRSKYIYQ